MKDELSSIKFTYQKWYPANPQFSSLDISFVTEKVDFKNKTLEETAMKQCRGWLFEGQIYKKCEPLGFGIISRFYMECLQETARTNDPYRAIHILVTFVDHCRYVLRIEDDDLLKPFCGIFLDDYFSSWSGANCSQSCVYGVWRENITWSRNGTSGIENRCICEDGYWGENCTELCPGGVLHTCNNNGVCNLQNGSCTCRGNRISTYVNQTDKLPCSECLPGWKGAECNIGTKEQSVLVGNKNIDRGYCVAVGNTHFRTFDRTSFSIDLQGIHLLVGNDQVQIYLMSKACGMHPTCRRISEVFIISRFGESSIMLVNSQVKVFVRKKSTNDVSGVKESVTSEVEPTTYVQSLMRETTIRYGGAKKDRLEIQLGVYFHLLIFLYSNQLSVIVEEKSKSENINGICSYVIRNSSHVTLEPQVKFRNGTFVHLGATNKAVISQKLIANEFAKSFIWKNSTDLLLTNLSRYWAHGPGYMLYFSHNRIVGELVALEEELREWTIEFWIHPEKPADNSSNMCNKAAASEVSVKQVILSIEHENNRYLSLSYTGKLHFEWDNFIVSSDFRVMQNIWTHVSISWRSYDGRLRMQALSPCAKAQSFTRYNIKLGRTYSFNGALVMGQYLRSGRVILENDFIGAVDELRIWRYARSENDTESQAKKRVYFPNSGLLIAGYFDEITKSKVQVALATNPGSSTQLSGDKSKFTVAEKSDLNLMPLESPPQWLPSTVPFELEADYAVTFRTSNLSSTATETCYRKFYTGVLNTHCSRNLPRTAAFYYQACISDIAATENPGISEHLEVSFALLCGKEIDIPTCQMRDIYDGFPVCQSVEAETVWTGTTISLLLLGIVLVLIIFVVVIVKVRKNYVPQIAPEDRYAGDPAPEVDERPLFEGDPFRANSLQSLYRQDNSVQEEEDISGLVKTSHNFLDDGDILIQASPRRIMASSKPSLCNSYEEYETEF